MKNQDLNYIAAVEKAIKKKYGEDAIQNPAKFWDEEKEKFFLEQLKEFVNKQNLSDSTSELQNVNGVLITKKLLNKERKINCNVCERLLRKISDDIYMIKFDCCAKCYIKYVDGREERWQTGWRPKNVTKND